MSKLRDFLGAHLPDDAHLRATGRVFISITDTSNNKNMIVSEYDSKEDLIEVRVELVKSKKLCSNFTTYSSHASHLRT